MVNEGQASPRFKDIEKQKHEQSNKQQETSNSNQKSTKTDNSKNEASEHDTKTQSPPKQLSNQKELNRDLNEKENLPERKLDSPESKEIVGKQEHNESFGRDFDKDRRSANGLEEEDGDNE